MPSVVETKEGFTADTSIWSYVAMVCVWSNSPALETGEALSSLSATLFPFALACSLCASFDAAGQPLEERVLMECQTRFFKVVAAKDIYRELCQKKVIPQTVADQITKSHSVEKARGHLFDHMRDYGTLATLKVFCDVITSEKYDGFQAMQDFGAEIKRRLEQEGRCVWWWVGGCVSGCGGVDGCGGVLSELHPLGQ